MLLKLETSAFLCECVLCVRHIIFFYPVFTLFLPCIYKYLPIEILIEKRCTKFIWSCFNSHNLIVRNISMAANVSSFLAFGDNYRYLSYKYGITIHVWHLSLCKLYQCFDLYLLNYYNTIANLVFIRDLCILRENKIAVDDQDFTSTELIFMIDLLCTF